MDSPLFLSLYAALFLFSLGKIYGGTRAYSRRRKILNTPSQTIRGLAVGRAEVSGTVVPAERTLDAPWTGEDCVYVEYSASETRETDDGTETFEVARGEAAVPFYVDDGSDRVLVEPTTDATIIIEDDAREYRNSVGKRSAPPDNVMAYFDGERDLDGDAREVTTLVERVTAPIKRVLAVFDTGSAELDRGRRQLFRQTILEPGATVYVLGTALPRDPDAVDADASNAERLKLTQDGSNDVLKISDQAESGLATRYFERTLSGILVGLLIGVGTLFVLAASLL